MIQISSGNLLKADAEAIVNTVNCVGIMGKGVALQFKQAYPENFVAYAKACKSGEVQLGKMFVFQTGSLFNPRYIINFPTKNHWKEKSKLNDIKTGLKELVRIVRELDIQSIAVPPLGCGNGGLEWEEVRPAIQQAFAELENVHVLLWTPFGAPKADEIIVNTKTPNMTLIRALMVKLLSIYHVFDTKLSNLEIQKLAYFLEEAGQPLQFEFSKGQYGPYSSKLHHVLIGIEGHYIRGYGDGVSKAELHALPRGISDADEALRSEPDTITRLNKVSELIEGYESPYGMELLATVHWVCKQNPKAATSYLEAVRDIKGWTERKSELFTVPHIKTAWTSLKKLGWLDSLAK